MMRASAFVAAVPVGLALAACQAEPETQPDEAAQSAAAEPVQVVVADCYNAGGDVAIAINDAPLLVTPTGQRDDSTGVCFWDAIALPRSITLAFSGENAAVFPLERAAGQALLISAADPSRSGFVPKNQLKFD